MDKAPDLTKLKEEIALRKANLSEKSSKLGEKDFNGQKQPKDKFLHNLAVSVNYGQQNEAVQIVKEVLDKSNEIRVDGTLDGILTTSKKPIYEPQEQQPRQQKQVIREDLPRQNNASLTEMLDGGVNRLLSNNRNSYEAPDRFPDQFGAGKVVDREIEAYNKLMNLHIMDPEIYPEPPPMTESLKRKIENVRNQEQQQNQSKRQVINEAGNYNYPQNANLESDVIDIMSNSLGKVAGEAIRNAIIDAYIEEKVLGIIENNPKVFESIFENYLEKNQELVGKLLLNYIQKTKAKAGRV
jgi:hypothetical protein